ncbi:MAG: PHP domain-containing protein [Chloroflexi bacterium]|nr:PHP domain-containing protein [Chloroflexota bacterium]
MGKADLHIHTSYSYDSSCTVPAVLEWAANYTDLDLIAVTDHDRIDGALKAVELGPYFGIEVVPGCEISTRDGHLLALFIERPVPKGLPLLETVLRVGEQGGLCVAAHPSATFIHGLNYRAIADVLKDPDARRTLVGLETWNTGVFFQSSNRRAQQMNEVFKLSPTGSSDSHVVWTIGFGYTSFPGSTAQDLRSALLNRQTVSERAIAHRSPAYWPNHLVNRLLRKFGWVTWAEQPNADLVRRRLTEVQTN